jgi:hypothetical protein
MRPGRCDHLQITPTNARIKHTIQLLRHVELELFNGYSMISTTLFVLGSTRTVRSLTTA